MSEMTGKKFDGEKVDMDLLSPYALEKVAAVMTYGKTKYGRDNWRGGIVFSRLLAAVMRHINAYRKGETFDPETGLSHLSHASCGLMMLLEFEETRPELDDRYLKQDKKEETVEEKIENVMSLVKEGQVTIRIPEKVRFAVGEAIRHLNNDTVVTVAGNYYDEKGRPVLFVRDDDGKIYGVDPNFYKSIYVSGGQVESN